ncbi:MAG TPA: cytidine deaminase [Nocardioidaceae bacterium]|nr:cytidine deaminase [Nocardioidaceae bacterium]
MTDPEDQKIITLARSTRLRARATEGAAVRDTDGRTYAAATVDLPSLQLSALRLAVAMAASSGVDGLEAAAVTGAAAGAPEVSTDDLAAVRDLGGSGLSVFSTDGDGTVVSISTT